MEYLLRPPPIKSVMEQCEFSLGEDGFEVRIPINVFKCGQLGGDNAIESVNQFANDNASALRTMSEAFVKHILQLESNYTDIRIDSMNKGLSLDEGNLTKIYNEAADNVQIIIYNNAKRLIDMVKKGQYDPNNKAGMEVYMDSMYIVNMFESSRDHRFQDFKLSISLKDPDSEEK